MEKFIVSARKYRPTTFDEVVGQSHISSTLKNALVTEHLGHAYLFTGPRGVGKTTCARILAKVVNCKNPVDKHSPCNECDSCSAFNENASFNIIELDAASNSSVDQMRSLTEQVRFQPQGGKYKVFIIDEVHMLTTNAFNAFLKTLEEPPPHVIFILATTEKHKIIPTILSRCQIFDFRRIQNIDIIKNLEHICEMESIECERDALHIIADKADGAMRDALSIFDRIVSSVDKVITYKDVITNLNILDYDYYFKLIDAILTEDLSKVLLLHNEISKNGFEGHIFINGFSEHLRQLMVSKDSQTLELIDASPELKKRYSEQASKTKLSFILSALNIANECDISFARAHNKELHVEIALSKMVYLERKIYSSTEDPAKKKNKSVGNSFEAEKKTLVKKTKEESPVKKVDKVEKKEVKKESSLKISKLSKLQEEVQKEIKDKKIHQKPFSKEMVQDIVNQYIGNVTSPYLKNILQDLIIKLEEKQIVIFVPSKLSEDMVKQELSLMEQIRGSAPDVSFIIEVKVNKKLFPEYKELKPKKILTNKEKFELFQKKNTLLTKFVDNFDLKLDSD